MELTENQIEAAKTVGAAFKRADETKLRSLDLYAGWRKSEITSLVDFLASKPPKKELPTTSPLPKSPIRKPAAKKAATIKAKSRRAEKTSSPAPPAKPSTTTPVQPVGKSVSQAVEEVDTSLILRCNTKVNVNDVVYAPNGQAGYVKKTFKGWKGANVLLAYTDNKGKAKESCATPKFLIGQEEYEKIVSEAEKSLQSQGRSLRTGKKG